MINVSFERITKETNILNPSRNFERFEFLAYVLATVSQNKLLLLIA